MKALCNISLKLGILSALLFLTGCNYDSFFSAGNYPVAHKIVTLDIANGKSVNVDVWFPANRAKYDSLTTYAYYDLKNTITERARNVSDPGSFPLTPDQIIALLNGISLYAGDGIRSGFARNANANNFGGVVAAGKHPVVMYSHGGTAMGYVYENYLLMEKLASYGYVVLSVRHRNDDLEGERLDDIKNVYENIFSEIGSPYVDRNKLALVGFSFGGTTAFRSFVTQQFDAPGKTALISLDGTHMDQITSEIQNNPEVMSNVPVLMFSGEYGRTNSHRIGPGFDVYAELTNTYYANFSKADHLNFSDSTCTTLNYIDRYNGPFQWIMKSFIEDLAICGAVTAYNKGVLYTSDGRTAIERLVVSFLKVELDGKENVGSAELATYQNYLRPGDIVVPIPYSSTRNVGTLKVSIKNP